MIQESLLYTLLMLVAVVLAVAYTFEKVKTAKPYWQLRAELCGSFAGLVILFMLATIASIPGSDPEFFQEEVIRYFA